MWTLGIAKARTASLDLTVCREVNDDDFDLYPVRRGFHNMSVLILVLRNQHGFWWFMVLGVIMEYKTKVRISQLHIP